MQEAKNVWRKKNKGRKWPRPDGACVCKEGREPVHSPLVFPNFKVLADPLRAWPRLPRAQRLEVANHLSFVGLKSYEGDLIGRTNQVFSEVSFDLVLKDIR